MLAALRVPGKRANQQKQMAGRILIREMEESVLPCPTEFPFPFIPYRIQTDFMCKLYEVLESRSLGVFESPTGTGKSMSMICGSLKWLFDAEERKKHDLEKQIASLDKKLKEKVTSEDWLNEHHATAKAREQKFELDKTRKAIKEMELRIQQLLKRAKDGEVQKKRRKHYGKSKGKENVSVKGATGVDVADGKMVEDDDVLLEQDGDAIQFTSDESEPESEVDKYHCPKIFICSRTHSQLTQLAGEIRKSPFASLGVRVVCLASRQNLCINDAVLGLNSMTLINEACQDLRSRKSSRATKLLNTGVKAKKQKVSSSGCPYTAEPAMGQLQAEVVAEVHDLEELVAAGRELKACPYYTARNSIKDGHVVLVPYQTLLHRRTREASGIDVAGSVVIIDEAHNLLDTLASMHSASVTGMQLCHAHSLLVQYRDRFQERFSPLNLLHLNQLIFVVQKLVRQVTSVDIKEGSSVATLPEFLISAEIDNINLYSLLDFANKARLANKLRGFCCKYQPTVTLPEKKTVNSRAAFLKQIKTKDAPQPAIADAEAPAVIVGSPVLSVIGLLEALTNHSEDVRVVAKVSPAPAASSLKIIILNPAKHFKDIVSKARAVIVAGGTMQPFSEFTDQLFLLSGGSPERVRTFSCGHVVPPENILPIVVSRGPAGRLLDFSYSLRNSPDLLDDLGRLLVNVCSVIPAGVVVFFPSYEYEAKVYQYLADNGVISKLEAKKKVLREPRQSGQVETVLAEYSSCASSGALLFSVVGGKLSEGLNFSDDLGRCVIVVGLPYPNRHSPELNEKITYLEKNVGKKCGSAYYENLCMKAVNQSIGRSVRHARDYAAVLLVDHRYSRPHTVEALPAWIRSSLSCFGQFGPVMALLGRFFSSKKTSQLL